MNWGSAAEFFAMGGYAPYVWGSYAVTRALPDRRAARRARASARRGSAAEGARGRSAEDGK